MHSISALLALAVTSALSDQTVFAGRIDERLAPTEVLVEGDGIVARDDLTVLLLGSSDAGEPLVTRCSDRDGGLLVVVLRDGSSPSLKALGPDANGRLAILHAATLPAHALSVAAGGDAACRAAVVLESGLVLSAGLRTGSGSGLLPLAPTVVVPPDVREHPRGVPILVDEAAVFVGDADGVRCWSFPDRADGPARSARAPLPGWPLAPAALSGNGALFATADGAIWQVDEQGGVELLAGTGPDTGPLATGLTVVEGTLWWASLDGRVLMHDGAGVHPIWHLPAGARQPLLYADLVDRGRPQVLVLTEDAALTLLDPVGREAPRRLALGVRALGAARVLDGAGERPLLGIPVGRARFLGPVIDALVDHGPPASASTPPGSVDIPGTVVGRAPRVAFSPRAPAPPQPQPGDPGSTPSCAAGSASVVPLAPAGLLLLIRRRRRGAG